MGLFVVLALIHVVCMLVVMRFEVFRMFGRPRSWYLKIIYEIVLLLIAPIDVLFTLLVYGALMLIGRNVQ